MERTIDDGRIVAALSAAYLVVDPSGIIVAANERAAAVFAARSEPLVGAAVESVLAPLDVLLQSGDDAATRSQCEFVRPSGEALTIGYSAAPLDADGGAVVILRDITEVEQLRQERDRLLRMAAVSEVLPAILHELKNPLASIGTTVELLIEDIADAAVREDLHAVLSEIRRMSFTLDGLGSVERELPSHRFQAIDYALSEVCRVFARRATERGVELRCDVQSMPLLPLEAGVVRGVVFNLITNALHACDAGAQIALDASFDTQSQELSIEVRDSGAGMPPSVRERCTELFYTTKKKGSGIGLALTHGAVQSAGGRLDIDSAPGRGTRIRLTIPVPDAGGTDARRYETKSGLRRAVSTTEPGVSNVAHR